jgi:NADPH:quinone reductase-like Zn-dependent oxidoreductase
MVVGDLRAMLAAPWQRATIGGAATATAEGFATLMSLAERGVLRPVIDSVLPFERVVDAHRRVDGGHKVGSLVLAL